MVISLNQMIDSASIGSAFRIKDSEGTPKISMDECWSRWEYQMFDQNITIFQINRVQNAPKGVPFQQEIKQTWAR